ncbi:MAG: pyridoxamine 5'-phosphate oxidase family protein [Thermoleophilia bacterium]|nr:pyridoxamine 5'-phosphate oxidase family protein [Thermoleophilia bacterium]
MTEPVTDRTRVRRHPERGAYDRATVDAILDEALVCYLGFVHDGQPYVIPTLHARVGDTVYLHGSAASRMLRTLAAGAPVCLTVTIVDGLVLARTAYNQSANYRSAMVLGRARIVDDPDEKLRALEAFTEQLVPGRWAEVRPPSPSELKATTIAALALAECSAKARSGPPGDSGEDLDYPVWAGVVPLAVRAGAPVAAPGLAAGLEPPAYALDLEAARAARLASS